MWIDGRVAPRSGLASKHSIDTGAGVIDADYRGEVKVLLFNLSDVDFTAAVGDRIAQLVLERVSFYTQWVSVSANCPRSIHPRSSLSTNWRRVFVALGDLGVRETS